MYGRLLRCSLLCPLVVSGCALIGYDLDAVGSGGPGGDREDGGVNLTASDAGGTPGPGARDASSNGTGGSGSGGRSRAGSDGGAGGAGASMPAGDGAVPPPADGGPPVNCDGSNDGAPCDDGRFCSVGDRCVAGECMGFAERDCSQLDYTCNEGECDEELDACTAKPVANGSGRVECGPGAYCVSGACAAGEDCQGGDNCSYTCPGTTCNYDCTDAGTCTVDCAAGSSCYVISCWNAACEVTCAAGSSCMVNCTGSNDCSDIVCEDGAECAIDCSQNELGRCGYEACGATGGPQLCPSGNWLVCNHECP